MSLVVAMGLATFAGMNAEPAAPEAPLAIEAPALDLNAAVVDAAAPAVDAQEPPPPRPKVWRVANLADDSSVVLQEGVMGRRPLVNALAAAHVSPRDAQRLLRAFDGIRKFDRLSPKDAFIVARDKAKGSLRAFEYIASPTEVWQARVDDGGTWSASKLAFAIETRRVRAAFVVKDDLRAAVAEAHVRETVLDLLDDALDGHVGLADVRPGARFRLIGVEELVEGEFSRYAELPAVEYTPASGQGTLRVYHFAKADKKAMLGYYDAKGQRPFRGGWRSPVPLARITSRFSPRRFHPILKTYMPHNGVDFGAAPGTPVYASAAGAVSSVGDGGPCGNMVQVKHANGLVTAYCHLSRFAAGLGVGQKVEGRQVIGYVGQTGRARGPHLHFAVKRGDIFIDPLALRLDGVRVLAPRDRDAFQELRRTLDAELDAIEAARAPETAASSGDAGTEEELDLH